MILYGSPIGRACIVFLGLSTSVGAPGTGGGRRVDGTRRCSPVNLWFDLDKIATETLFVGTDSHTHPEQHIKNIEQSK